MPKLVLCLAASGAALVLAPAASAEAAQAQAPAGTGAREALLAAGSSYLLGTITRYRRETWHWQRLMGKRPTPTSFEDRATRKPSYRRWIRDLWKKRAVAARRAARRPPHLRQWLCIYRHERHPRQGWRTRTGNGYYGGLQMDLTFQRRYAAWLLRRKGTANRWSAVEQIWVAERGRKAQGWYAWPMTARACGLI